MPVLTCPKCQDDIDYEMEQTDNGDGPWSVSGWVGYVLWTTPDDGGDGFRTTCGCVWDAGELAALDQQATEAAGEWVEP